MIPSSWAGADPLVTTPADVFKAGRDFAQPGSTAAAGTVNSDSAQQNLPSYTTTAPQSDNFGDGRGAVGAAGSAKQLQCQTTRAADAYAQQECDAINFLGKNPSVRPKFTLDKTRDPLLTGSGPIIRNPGGIPGSSSQQCRVVSVNNPATTTTQVCEQSIVTEAVNCNKTLVPQCAYTGAAISGFSASKSGAFTAASMSATDTRGLYTYDIAVPYRNCGGDGTAELDFQLDTVGLGSYLSLNVSNLDDAAAVAVNGYTVFAGYPNNGPVYSGVFFPLGTPSFQIGYSWVEDAGSTCTAYDLEGNCTVSLPKVQTFYANTKLLDYCPGGYAPMQQSDLVPCDDLGCTTPDSFTPYNIPGFFCNSEGKFLMNRHEGVGTWAGSVWARMPLQSGANTIAVYWGTGTSGTACGNVSVSGQIYNVAPTCDAPWDDGCAALRAAQ